MRGMETKGSVHLVGPSHRRMILKISRKWEFPGVPVVGTQCFHCQGQGSIPRWETESKKRKEGSKNWGEWVSDFVPHQA